MRTCLHHCPESCRVRLTVLQLVVDETSPEGVCWAADLANGRSGAWDDWVMQEVELGIILATSCGCCRIRRFVGSGSGGRVLAKGIMGRLAVGGGYRSWLVCRLIHTDVIVCLSRLVLYHSAATFFRAVIHEFLNLGFVTGLTKYAFPCASIVCCTFFHPSGSNSDTSFFVMPLDVSD